MIDCLALIMVMSAQRRRLRFEILRFSIGYRPHRTLSLQKRVQVLDLELSRLRALLSLLLV